MGVGWSALWLSETQYQPKGDGVLHVCWGGRPSSKTSLSGELKKFGPPDTNIDKKPLSSEPNPVTHAQNK